MSKRMCEYARCFRSDFGHPDRAAGRHLANISAVTSATHPPPLRSIERIDWPSRHALEEAVLLDLRLLQPEVCESCMGRRRASSRCMPSLFARAQRSMLDGIGSLARQHVRRMCLVNHQRLDVELMPTGPPPPPTPSSANYARRATRT